MGQEIKKAASSCPERFAKRVMLLGLDAADWGIVSEKIASGSLPNLARLAGAGYCGPLRSIRPMFSPALWASIATGKRPFRHGVTGFFQADASGATLRPFDSFSRRVPALWNILSQAGMNSQVIGWWSSSPAEPIIGTMVAEAFRIAHRPVGEPWEVPEGSVFPPERTSELAVLRAHPQALRESLLRRLIPRLYEVDPSEDLRISGVAKILAEDLSNQRIAMHLMSTRPWDFLTVYLIGLDSLGHLAMQYRSPALPDVKPRDVEIYGEVVDRAYTLYDEWIGELVQGAGENTTVIVVSDHGFYHDERRPRILGIEDTAPCAQHAPLGVLIMAGPGILAHRENVAATILDICPTILNLMGLPGGRDMDGRALHELLAPSRRFDPIASWDSVWERAGRGTGHEPSPETTLLALRQLVAMGYLKAIPEDKGKAIREEQCNRLVHLALACFDDDRIARAVALLEQARAAARERTDILTWLAEAYALTGHCRLAAARLKQLVRCQARDVVAARRRLAEREMELIELKGVKGSEGLNGVGLKKLSWPEAVELRALVYRANVDARRLDFLAALADWHGHGRSGDRERLVRLAALDPENLFFSLRAGAACIESGATEEGIAFLQRAAALDPDEPEAPALLARAEIAAGRPDLAEAHAREALRRDPLHAPGWLSLARVLMSRHGQKNGAEEGAGLLQEAAKAARRAARSQVIREEACELLAEIALSECGDGALAARYRRIGRRAGRRLRSIGRGGVAFATQDTSSEMPVLLTSRNAPGHAPRWNPDSSQSCGVQPRIVVVTGLPRSGTSLLMQMLASGGMAIHSDNVREADEHNPRGYYELEQIRESGIGELDLRGAAGCALKIVIPLVWRLPSGYDYRIILVRRKLDEVIESQRRMAGLTGTRDDLLAAYRHYEERTLEIFGERRWNFLELAHGSILADPREAAQKVADFLGGPLSQEAMAGVVRPELHRVRDGKEVWGINPEIAFQP